MQLVEHIGDWNRAKDGGQPAFYRDSEGDEGKKNSQGSLVQSSHLLIQRMEIFLSISCLKQKVECGVKLTTHRGCRFCISRSIAVSFRTFRMLDVGMHRAMSNVPQRARGREGSRLLLTSKVQLKLVGGAELSWPG